MNALSLKLMSACSVGWTMHVTMKNSKTASFCLVCWEYKINQTKYPYARKMLCFTAVIQFIYARCVLMAFYFIRLQKLSNLHLSKDGTDDVELLYLLLMLSIITATIDQSGKNASFFVIDSSISEHLTELWIFSSHLLSFCNCCW